MVSDWTRKNNNTNNRKIKKRYKKKNMKLANKYGRRASAWKRGKNLRSACIGSMWKSTIKCNDKVIKTGVSAQTFIFIFYFDSHFSHWYRWRNAIRRVIGATETECEKKKQLFSQSALACFQCFFFVFVFYFRDLLILALFATTPTQLFAFISFFIIFVMLLMK